MTLSYLRTTLSTLLIGLLLIGGVQARTPRKAGKAHRHAVARCESCPRDTHGRIKRDKKVRQAFARQTGYTHGRPGYVIDHVVPLACGGADAVGNLQWQTVADAKAKDRTERSCR